MPRNSPWPERDDQLRRLWMQRDPQLSTKQIGEIMGLSKNAVVGRSGRLGLPSRPSPIQARSAAPAAPKPPRAPRQTLAPAGISPAVPTRAPGVTAPGGGTSSAPAAVPPPSAVLAGVAPSLTGAVGAPFPAPRYLVRGQAVPSAHASSVILPPRPREALPVLGPRTPGSTCRWPLWGFGERPTHRYCDAARDPRCGAPYCAQHAAKARSRIQDAA